MPNNTTTQQITNPEAGLFHDPGRRFPIFTGAKGYEAMPFLSKEEKAIGVEMLWARMQTPDQKPEEFAVQARNPAYVMQSDPVLWREEMRHYAVLTQLLYGTTYDDKTAETHQSGSMHGRIQDPDELRRYQLGQLMIAKLGQVLGPEYNLKLLGVAQPWSFLSRQQIALLDRPRSSVWSEEQSLALEFTEAIVKMNMSDALFARAQEKWGTKLLLRYAKWIAFYTGWIMVTILDVNDADKDGSVRV